MAAINVPCVGVPNALAVPPFFDSQEPSWYAIWDQVCYGFTQYGWTGPGWEASPYGGLWYAGAAYVNLDVWVVGSIAYLNLSWRAPGSVPTTPPYDRLVPMNWPYGPDVFVVAFPGLGFQPALVGDEDAWAGGGKIISHFEAYNDGRGAAAGPTSQHFDNFLSFSTDHWPFKIISQKCWILITFDYDFGDHFIHEGWAGGLSAAWQIGAGSDTNPIQVGGTTGPPPEGTPGTVTPGTGSTLSLQQLLALAQAHGFPNPQLAAAVAYAESSGNLGATNLDSDGSVDRGLWQINSIHSQYDGTKLLTDADYNADAAYAISSGGTDWSPWVTYNSGAYLVYYQQLMGGS